MVTSPINIHVKSRHFSARTTWLPCHPELESKSSPRLLGPLTEDPVNCPSHLLLQPNWTACPSSSIPSVALTLCLPPAQSAPLADMAGLGLCSNVTLVTFAAPAENGTQRPSGLPRHPACWICPSTRHVGTACTVPAFPAHLYRHVRALRAELCLSAAAASPGLAENTCPHVCGGRNECMNE